MPRMTSKQAEQLLQKAYDALDSFDSTNIASMSCDMMSARHYLRELRDGYILKNRARSAKRPTRAAAAPLTGLELDLWDEHGVRG